MEINAKKLDLQHNLEYAAICANRSPNSCLDCSHKFLIFGSGRYVVVYNRQKKCVTNLLLAHKGIVSSVHLIQHLVPPTRHDNNYHEQFILSASHDKSCVVWSRTQSTNDDFKPLFKLTNASHDIILAAHSVIISTENTDKTIVTVSASLDYGVNLWINDDLKSSIKVKYYVYDIKISALWCHELKKDIHLVFLGASDDMIHVFRCDLENIDSKNDSMPVLIEFSQISGHSDWVRSIDILLSADRSTMLLASASQDKFSRIWRLSLAIKTYPSLLVKASQLPSDKTTDNEPIHLLVSLETVLAGHESRIYSVRWNKSKRRLVPKKSQQKSNTLELLTCSADKSIMLWESALAAPTHDNCEIMETDSHHQVNRAPAHYERQLTDDIWQETLRLGEAGENNLSLLGAVISCDHGEDPVIFAYSLNGALHSWRCHDQDPSHDPEGWVPEPVVSGHFGPVTDIAWQRDGKYFITSSLDKTCRLHSCAKRGWLELARPQVHGYEINCIALVNSLRFISGGDEKTLRLFEATKTLVRDFQIITGYDLMESSDDSMLIRSMNLELSELAQAPALGLSNRAIEPGTNGVDVEKIRGGQDKPSIDISGDEESPVEEVLLQSTLWPEVQKFYGHSYEIFAVDCDKVGEHIASASKANKSEFASLIIWCAKTFNQLATLENHTLTVTRIQFSPDNNYILSVSRDRTWCLRENSRKSRFAKVAGTTKNNAIHTRIIWDCSWTPNSQCFVTVSRERKAIAWSLEQVINESNTNLYTVLESNCLSLPSSIQAVDIVNHFTTDKNNDWLVAIGLESGDISLARLQFDNEKFEFRWSTLKTISQAHSLALRRLAFRPQLDSDNNKDTNKILLATGGEDNLVQLISISCSFVN